MSTLATVLPDRRAAVKQLLGDGREFLIVCGLAGSKSDVLGALGSDAENVFPLGGAMGAAVSMGLGLALARPDRQVLVVTGEGELLMNLGALATVGVIDPPNLSIVCVDNERYAETGFQESHTARGVDLAAIASGAGIGSVRTVREEGELDAAAQTIRNANSSAFVLLKVAPNDPPKVPLSWDAVRHRHRFKGALAG
jgi:phosphonopyruvate decarboxylase